MRVLWFVNMPLPAVSRHLGQPPMHHGSWLTELEVLLRGQPDLALGIAATTHIPFAPFESEGVAYYGVGAGEPARAVARVAGRWHGLIRPKNDLAEMQGVVAAFRPDIIHVHGTERAFGLLAGKTASPVVVSMQGVLSACALVGRRGVDLSLLRSLSPSLFVRGTGAIIGQAAIQRAAARERHIIRQCRYFIGRTRFDEDVVRVMNPPARYYHCDEPLRSAFHEVTWLHEGSEPYTVYSLAGSYALKGVGSLLRAIAVLREGPVPPIRLRLAGLHTDHSESGRALAREIRRLHLEPCVTVVGRLGPDDLAKELLRARVFALPTHADNSPNSLAEAMLVGTPCVASAAGGIPSLARDGVEALLVQDGDHYALAGTIGRVLEDSSLACRLSRSARSRALRRHDPATIRETLLAVYRDVLADTGLQIDSKKGR